MNKDELLEFVKCKQDPVYFIETYCKIRHPKQGLIPFKLYNIQKEFVKAFIENDYVIVNKSRQVGMTTLMSALALHRAMFFKHQLVIIISAKDAKAKSFLKKIKLTYDYLPEFFKDEVKGNYQDNMHIKEFSSGSTIISEASGGVASESAARGESANLVIIDEAAFIRNFQNIWTSSLPTLSRGGRAVVISTPNGVNNYFYTLYKEAEEGKNNFKPFFINWRDIPEYTQEWYERTRKNYTDKEWAQEYEGDFVSSGSTLVSGSILKNKITIKPLVIDRNLYIWKQPEKDKKYVVAVDCAEKDSEDGDYTAIQVLETSNLEQVAELYDKLDLDSLSIISTNLAKSYNDAILTIERNGIGYGLIQFIIRNYPYQNLYRERRSDSKTGTDIKPGRYGFHTNARTRPILIKLIKEYFSNENSLWYSERLKNELLNFVYNENGKIESSNNCHDDLIFAFAIALYVAKDNAIASLSNNINLFRKQQTELSHSNFGIPIYQQRYRYVDEYARSIIESDLLNFFNNR